MIAGGFCSQLYDSNCYWDYRCCSFREVEGELACVRMCAPRIKCDKPTKPSVKSEEYDETYDDNAPSEIRLPSRYCRKGFQFKYGKCRKVY
jgi:hypothetical protein